MAVNTTGDLNGGANTSGTNFDASKVNQNRGGRMATDVSLISLFRDRQKFLSLSEEGTKYIEILKKLNNDSNTRFQFESLKTNSNIVSFSTIDGTLLNCLFIISNDLSK